MRHNYNMQVYQNKRKTQPFEHADSLINYLRLWKKNPYFSPAFFHSCLKLDNPTRDKSLCDEQNHLLYLGNLFVKRIDLFVLNVHELTNPVLYYMPAKSSWLFVHIARKKGNNLEITRYSLFDQGEKQVASNCPSKNHPTPGDSRHAIMRITMQGREGGN